MTPHQPGDAGDKLMPELRAVIGRAFLPFLTPTPGREEIVQSVTNDVLALLRRWNTRPAASGLREVLKKIRSMLPQLKLDGQHKPWAMNAAEPNMVTGPGAAYLHDLDYIEEIINAALSSPPLAEEPKPSLSNRPDVHLMPMEQHQPSTDGSGFLILKTGRHLGGLGPPLSASPAPPANSDGWVLVDDDHPLPMDLDETDEVLLRRRPGHGAYLPHSYRRASKEG